MTQVKFHKDAFIDLSFHSNNYANSPSLPTPLGLSTPYIIDSFENPFEAQFRRQIKYLEQAKVHLKHQFSQLKDDEKSKNIKEILMVHYADLENREKLLAFIAEQTEKSSQIIAANFR